MGPNGRGWRAIAVAALAVLLAGCATGATATPAPGSPSPSVEPTPSSASITIEVIPVASVGKLFGGSPYVFLVTVPGDEADDPVAISATAGDAEVSVEPTSLEPGAVGEVSVVPPRVTTETSVEVVITATRDGAEAEARRVLEVVPDVDTLGPEAMDHFGPFVSWLAANRPELGITDETTWEGLPGAWVLIVSHYLYLSDGWEAGLAWHVMVPPDDWSTLYLRRRWTEARPSVAFEIPSVAGGSEPREVEPPDSVWR